VEGTLRTARRLDPEARREQIVAAAICYFAEVGFGGTTRDLAARIGITQALLYRYFASKADLAEAVFERVYLDRLNPRWINDIRDRQVPLEQRLSRFYRQYGAAIFTYEWMRIFMWAGLAGERLNQRYLTRVGEKLLMPLREEIAADPALREPTMEEMWALHGGIVYIGIRRFIYQLPTPDEDGPVIDRTVANFLRALRREAEGSSRAAPRAAARSGRVSSRR
jgi:AcrR family transcriptional regulator